MKLISTGLLPAFTEASGQQSVLVGDVAEVAPAIPNGSWELPSEVLGQLFAPAALPLGGSSPHSWVQPPPDRFSGEGAARPAIRRLAQIVDHNMSQPMSHVPYFPGQHLVTRSRSVADIARGQIDRWLAVSDRPSSVFRGSAAYMGSKRALAAFLVEALDGALPRDGVVIDVMCGSGAASAAFSRSWDTIASDAQPFALLLAKVQGGGLSASALDSALPTLVSAARKNTDMVLKQLSPLVELEDSFFHSDVTASSLQLYIEFMKDVPLYLSDRRLYGWDPEVLVRYRRQDSNALPYCLVTTYYANIYFGLRQAIEIDSLRFAIDQVPDPNLRTWCLGALIICSSALATSYGHFAQPKVHPDRPLSLRQFSEVIERRSYSITHEFMVRISELAAQSEQRERPIRTVPGPWQPALENCAEIVGTRPVVVYLDAPYRREEYSRYYHVLDTLTRYDYPEVEGIGRVPKKLHGPRFASEFFTRSASRLVEAYAAVIGSVLSRGWICAWSYADSGDVAVSEVVRAVEKRVAQTATSYAVPHIHQAQGGRSRKPRRVTEYVILFRPGQDDRLLPKG